MPMAIGPYQPDQESAVARFNRRLAAGGCEFRFPETARSPWLPKLDDENLYEEYFLVGDGSEVRGGYILKYQPFFLRGDIVPVACLYLPLSEGAVDPRYNRIGPQLVTNALRRHPLLFSLGMGGLHLPYPRLLKAMGWTLIVVPFFAMLLNPATCLRNLRPLRTHPWMAVLIDAAAATGLASIGIRALHRLLGPWGRRRGLSTTVVTEFGSWVDDIWRMGSPHYSLTAVRDHQTLTRLYPAHEKRYVKLQISERSIPVGWVVALDTAMTNHKQFGDLRVGSIIDCFAAPGHELSVALAATAYLKDCGVDLIVSNQAHLAWRAAFRRSGYLRGPSNFIFAASGDLAARLQPIAQHGSRVHFVRGDGEGPSHL